MSPPVELVDSDSSKLVRFGVFELNLRAGELRKSGYRLKLQEQPFQVLAALLESPGDVVTRDELRRRLWPNATFVDFDLGLNTAVKKLRQALGDSASNPRFVETLPKRGYRFVYPVEQPEKPSESADFSTPREWGEISHYRVIEKIGEGGMGVVYKAEDTKLERPVALKFLANHAMEEPDLRARFIREAKAAARLDHPNICSIFEIDEVNGQIFLAMAFLEGQTIKEKIRERPLKLIEALDLTIQTAEGLRAAHEKGVVHRDIKSANLMVSPRGRVKIMDFGVAQVADGTKLTMGSAMLGTPAYMSPEQAKREPTDRRTDIWSLAVVLYEMVTGRVPFESDQNTAALHAIIHDDHEPITAVRVGLPIEVDHIVGKALAKNRDERYQHVDDLLVDLRALKGRWDEGSRGQFSATPPLALRDRRHVWIAAALAVGALAVAASVPFGNSDPTAEAPQGSLEAVPLTTYPGSEGFPSLSPDGSHVAFSWDGPTQTNHDIYIQGATAGRPLQLTSDPLTDTSPAYSPDGEHIAFARILDDARSQVIVIPTLGGRERVLGPLLSQRAVGVPGPYFSWTPDSKWLVTPALEPRPAGGLDLLSVETGERRPLIQSQDAADSFPYGVISPNGKTLAYVNHPNLFVIDLSRDLQTVGRATQLTFDSGRLRITPTWTRDGRRIVYAVMEGASRRGLWVVAPEVPGQERFVGLPGDSIKQPSIAALNDRMAYASHEPNVNLWRLDLQGEIAVGLTRLASSTLVDTNAHFSPDGKRIVFASWRSGSRDIWIADADGTSPTRIAALEGGVSGTPKWSPDGRWIAFDARLGDRLDVYLADLRGGRIKRLTGSTTADAAPNWSSDGAWVYFKSRRTGESCIWKVPVGGGDAVQVTSEPALQAAESPDGRWLYYVGDHDNRGLWKMPAEGGEPIKVHDLPTAHGFAVTGDGVYFLYRASWGRSSDLQPGLHQDLAQSEDLDSIRFFDFSTGRTLVLTEVEFPMHLGMSVSADGSSIVYSQIEDTGSDLMLVPSFRP